MAALIALACSEATTPPQTGSLEVSVETAGGDPDEDGYSLVIDSESPKYVPAFSSRLFDNLVAGTHVLQLSGIADNCSLDGPRSRSITIASGETAHVVFAVRCDATGIEVTTRTTGSDQPAGYQLKIVEPLPKIGERHASVGASATLLTSRLQPGIHTVTLFVFDNCTATGGNVVTVDVSSRAVTPVTFEITCVRIDKRLAFVHDSVAGNSYHGSFVVVGGERGSVALRIASGHGPAWSPDGTRLAYSNAECDYYYGQPCKGGLVIIDPETSIARDPGSARLGLDPSWSPDGKLIAFSRIPRNPQTLITLNLASLNDSTAVELPTQGRNARHPSWSPDGQHIVFQCFFGNQPGSDICVINKDGTGFKQLTERAGWNGTPAWSPDGSKIAFATDFLFSGGTAVALMNPDGTGVTRLTTGWDPGWSPDGSKLIFAQGGLFTIGPDGSSLTRITTGRHHDPSWRP